MGVPVGSNNILIGSLTGKPNAKKLTKIYNEAYKQISQLWNMLPESTSICLKSEAEQSENMDVDEPFTRKDKIHDLEERINSLKGKPNSYKEKMAKKKLKNQLKKKKKSEEKHMLKEEMKKKKKALKEQKMAEKLKNGEISDGAIEKDIGETVENESSDEDESEEDHEESAEDSRPIANKNKGKRVEEFAQEDEQEEENNQKGTISKKKQKLLKKQELQAAKKREKRKLMKQKKKEAALAKVQELIKADVLVDPAPIVNSKTSEVMYNKIDLEGENVKKKYKKEKPRTEKDPSKALTKIEELNQKITDLKEAGDEEKAAAIKSKEAWKTAILRADGVKVKDDVKLLKKTIRRKEKKKNKSKTDWDKRKEITDKRMADAQKKRKENIQKKKKEKKQRKIKKSIKKGRIVI